MMRQKPIDGELCGPACKSESDTSSQMGNGLSESGNDGTWMAQMHVDLR